MLGSIGLLQTPWLKWTLSSGMTKTVVASLQSKYLGVELRVRQSYCVRGLYRRVFFAALPLYDSKWIIRFRAT